MKRKSNHKKAKKEEVEVKEVGTFNDFLIMEKEKKDNDDSNDLSFLKDWINLENPFSDKSKNKSKKSRFCDLFKEIEKEEKE